MAKIPFTLDAWLEDKSQKVETRDGRLVHNIWRVKEPTYTNNRKTEVCALIDGEEDALVFFEGGRYLPTTKDTDSPFDLFIITPEPELSEFEDKLRIICENAVKEAYLSPGRTSEEFAKNHAAELLAIARDQFIKDGYIIEKKAFHDAVEKIDDKNKAEMSTQYSLNCIVENGTRHAVMNWKSFQKLAQHFIDIGEADALKDLPRWRKWENGACGNGQGIPLAIVKRESGVYKLVDALGIQGEEYIMLSDLEKLPGFKEDEK